MQTDTSREPTWQGYAQVSVKARASGFTSRVVHGAAACFELTQSQRKTTQAPPLPQQGVYGASASSVHAGTAWAAPGAGGGGRGGCPELPGRPTGSGWGEGRTPVPASLSRASEPSQDLSIREGVVRAGQAEDRGRGGPHALDSEGEIGRAHV